MTSLSCLVRPCARAFNAAPVMSTVSPLLDRLLKENGGDKYHIEYRVFFSNHLAHGLIALEKIGGTEKDLKDFLRKYGRKLEPAIPTDADITTENWQEWIGQRKDYHALLQFFKRQTDLTGLSAVIDKYVPPLMNGISGAATHPLITFGYGMIANHTPLTIEGLAYMVFAHEQLTPSPRAYSLPEAQMKDNIFELLEGLRANNPYTDEWFEEQHDKVDDWKLGAHLSSFQDKMIILGHKAGDEIQDMVARLHVEGSDFGVKRAIDACRMAVEIYTAAGNDDFFLLHGVTSGWAMINVVGHITDEEQRKQLVHHYLTSLVAIYIVQGAPELKSELLLEKPVATWEEIMKKCHETWRKDDDIEHYIKFVYSCHELSRVDADQAGESAPTRDLYRLCAARKVGLE